LLRKLKHIFLNHLQQQLRMSDGQQTSKFVSSIPNNKLEPVYLGGAPSSTNSNKTNGVYVPGFLKGEKETPKQVVPQNTYTEFPSLSSAAGKQKGSVLPNSAPKQTESIVVENSPSPKVFLNYSNAAKQLPLVKPVEKPNEPQSKFTQLDKNVLRVKQASEDFSGSEDSDFSDYD
jgi:hypothetical protein